MNEIDHKIVTISTKLFSGLSIEEKKRAHYKSVNNFVYHLIHNQKYASNRNIKLQEINEKRIKQKLYDYLSILDNKKEVLSINQSSELFDEYIYVIGKFMSEYYSFLSQGGKLKVMTVFSILFAGFVMDFIFYLVFNKYIYLTILLISIFYLRNYIKKSSNRLYGFNY